MFCAVDGMEIYYETYGEGIPLLAIHGFGVDHHALKSCIEPIFKDRTGYKRIYFDLPGMGRTKAAKWVNNTDDMLKIVTGLIDELIPSGDFLVAGASYGSLLSRGLIYRMPERIAGALLIVPVIVFERSKRELPAINAIARDEGLLARLGPADREQFEHLYTVLTEEIWRKNQEYVVAALKLADISLLGRITKSGYGFSFDVDRPGRPFDKPALVLMGRQDTSVGYKDGLKILDNYPRGTFAILDRAGHGLELEQETVFGCLAGEWLDRVEEHRSKH